jgi:hypothetical protein
LHVILPKSIVCIWQGVKSGALRKGRRDPIVSERTLTRLLDAVRHVAG